MSALACSFALVRARSCSFFVRGVGVLGPDGLLESRGLVSLVPLQHSAAILLDTMVARKTIVSLVGYLLIGWVVWIIVNFIEKTVSARSITVIFDFDISFNLFYFRTKIQNPDIILVFF